MERLVLAYGQIRATGYLRASEVRQLTEAGIPIVEELAKKMSELRGETVSAAEVMGMISERAISFGMVKEVFDDMTSAGGMFYKMQEKQAETLSGQWSNLQDSIAIMYEEIGNTERVNNAIKGMISLIKSLAENWQLLGNILKITAYQYGAMYAVSLFIPRLVQSTKLLKMAEEAHAKAKQMSNVATQRGNAIMAFSAKQTRIYAYWMRQAANAHTMFGRGVKRLAAMFLGGGWIGAVIGVLTVAVSWFISARKEANRLNKELERIGAEGALQADQSVRNFERLARAIRESANGSVEQSEAMAEMRRAYG
jgi:tape measure domain-containing protein